MRAIVVEDSRLARSGLIRMLQEYPSVSVVGAALAKLAPVVSASDDIDSKLSSSPSSLSMNSRIFVKDGDACHLVSLEQIHYFESCKNYVQVYFGETKAFIKKSMTQIERRLPQTFFFRANRQFIVNLQAISSINESISDGFDLTMSDGKVIEISRRNSSRLKELLAL